MMTYSAERAGPQGHSVLREGAAGGTQWGQPSPSTSGLPSLTAGQAAGEPQPPWAARVPTGRADSPAQVHDKVRLAYGYGRCRAGDWRGTAHPRPPLRAWSASPLTWGPQRTRCPASSLRTEAHPHRAVHLQGPALFSLPAATLLGPLPTSARVGPAAGLWYLCRAHRPSCGTARTAPAPGW